ncbi:MAG: U32 family peptidase [Clostridia bacterium]|nr:U32 family peptidase [Clostridia bacterium]
MKTNAKVELLAPAGDMEKLKTAIHFGADAVYFAGKNYGLRAMSSNFTEDEMIEAINYVHQNNKKAYVTLNVYARNNDFDGLGEYVKYLQDIGVDAVIVSDLGVFDTVRRNAPKLEIHISTQSNTTNKYSAGFYKTLGASRVVLARELSIEEIREIKKHNPDLELECFVHGAMCISYSGRCLLSNYLTGRDSNHGECVQACRWKYFITEESRPNEPMEIQEDDKGAYILNSKDMCLIEYLDQIIEAGVNSLKIEGRMKSPYYVATVINAYRRAIDSYYEAKKNGAEYKLDESLVDELTKASHRAYTTGFMFKDGKIRQNLASAAQEQTSKFVAIVKEVEEGRILVEMRNRFMKGDTLEILSPTSAFNKIITIDKMINSKGKEIDDAKAVCELVWIYTDVKGIEPLDILRK